MKRSELAFNLISVPMDIVMLLAAGVVSFYARAHFTEIVGPATYHLTLIGFLNFLIKVIPLQLVIFAFLALYNQRGTRKVSKEFGKVFIGLSVGLVLAILTFFFRQSLFPSRFIILAGWLLGTIFVVFGRAVLSSLQRFFFNKGYGLHRLVLINGDHKEVTFITKTFNDPGYGYKVVADLTYDDNIFPILENLYHSDHIDEIMQTNSRLSDIANLQLVEFARNKGLHFSFVPNLFEVQRNAVEIGELSGVPIISLKNTPLDGWGKVAKRGFDIVVSTVCLIITSPLFLVLWVSIRLDSSGRAIYSAPRGGRGKDFKFYKFRSMFTHLSVGDGYGGREAEKVRRELWKNSARGGVDGPLLKVKNDPRVTRVGRFLRKTKLDELPQFLNVLKGDMSMVGPRAHVLDEVERYRNRYRRMFSIKPGIFGLSQNAQMVAPDLPFEEEIRLATYYIENWGLWFDIKILAKSFFLLLFSKKSGEDY